MRAPVTCAHVRGTNLENNKIDLGHQFNQGILSYFIGALAQTLSQYHLNFLLLIECK